MTVAAEDGMLRRLGQSIGVATRERMIRTAIAMLRENLPSERQALRLVDVGCNDGRKTIRLAEGIGLSVRNLLGLELAPDLRQRAAALFSVLSADFECEALPIESASMDVVICDQVFEHLKNVHWLMDEIYRVLRPHGYFLVGVPNLAAWHNRLLLTLGRQPLCIGIFTAHVRAFTPPALRALVCFQGRMTTVEQRGSGFYPLPPSPVTDFLGGRLSTLAPYLYLLARKGAGNNEGALQRMYEESGRIEHAEHGWIWC